MALSATLHAQNDLGRTDDLGRIALTPYIDQHVSEKLPPGAAEHLRNKLDQVATANGLGQDTRNAPFIISANVITMGKEIAPTAPPKHVLNLDVTIAIGNGVDGVKFGSVTKSVKGIGDNETKAYIDALKNIKAKDEELAELIGSSKTRIIEYYNSQCDLIIQRAMGLSGQEKFAEAMNELMAVPEVCKDCHALAMEAAGSVYRAKLERECQVNMALAKAAVAEENFGEAARILSTSIQPGASCYDDASKLMADITKRADAQNKRNWNFAMKVWDDGVDIRKQEIAAYRAVGVAYGQNQQPTTFNVRGWW